MRIASLSLWISAFAFATAAVPARAELREYSFDPAHTSVLFLVDHFGFSRVVGRFGDVQGTLRYDPEQVEASSVEAVVQTGSIDTANGDRDEHLRSPDFFNAAEFPTMEFRSETVEKTGDQSARVQGTLSLLGATRPISLYVTFNKAGPHPLPDRAGVNVAGFSARSALRRSEFGMTGFLPSLGDEVEIWLEIEALHEDE